MVSVNDLRDRPARALADGEVLRTGRHAFKWLDTPHMPHAWDCGFMMELETRTLLCGDLFTQGGSGDGALTEARHPGPERGLPPADGLLRPRPAHRRDPRAPRREQPQVLACMHGSAWRGDGAALLRALAKSVESRTIALAA